MTQQCRNVIASIASVQDFRDTSSNKVNLKGNFSGQDFVRYFKELVNKFSTKIHNLLVLKFTFLI